MVQRGYAACDPTRQDGSHKLTHETTHIGVPLACAQATRLRDPTKWHVALVHDRPKGGKPTADPYQRQVPGQGGARRSQQAFSSRCVLLGQKGEGNKSLTQKMFVVMLRPKHTPGSAHRPPCPCPPLQPCALPPCSPSSHQSIRACPASIPASPANLATWDPLFSVAASPRYLPRYATGTSRAAGARFLLGTGRPASPPALLTPIPCLGVHSPRLLSA